MEDLENQVKKHIVSFCKTLPAHDAKWRSVLEQSVQPVQHLANLSEQQRHIQRTKIEYMEDFENAKDTLMSLVSTRIEEEILTLKQLIDSLSKTNNELKSKLFNLERLTLNLNWEDSESLLIRGSGSQPSLTRILQDGLEFWTFYSKSLRVISESFKRLDVYNDKTVKNLKESFVVDLNNNLVNNFIAITQYVDNEKNIL